MDKFSLPPLQTLIAFEASVRLRGFTRAADELALTQGAVSQHVRALEERLGRVLFVRERHGAEPTEEAQALALQIRQGLGILQRALPRTPPAVARRASTPLVLSTLPSVARRWLQPRLPALRAALPEVDLQPRVDSALARLDHRDGVDVALRYGPGRWPGLHSRKLAEEALFPVAAPDFRGGRLPRRRADLARHRLLCHPAQPWALWFQAAGLDLPEPDGEHFDDINAMLDAAIAGQGIALARATLIGPELADGRLVRLWKTAVRDVHAYHLVWRPDNPRREAIEHLYDWLAAAFAASPDR